MKKIFKTLILLLASMLFVTGSLRAHPSDASAHKAIRAVLDAQVEAWNRGDVDTFMQSYWNSDKTEFVGSSGIFRGWQAVLERYRKTYPDRRSMGTVQFSDLDITVLSPSAALVVGKYCLLYTSPSPRD